MEHDEIVAALGVAQVQFTALRQAPPISKGVALPWGVNGNAVYLFSEGDEVETPRYVGMTTRLRPRYNCHVGGREGNRSCFARSLIKRGEAADFDAAYDLIRNMRFRYLPVGTLRELCVLELYAALRLKVPYDGIEFDVAG